MKDQYASLAGIGATHVFHEILIQHIIQFGRKLDAGGTSTTDDEGQQPLSFLVGGGR